jgi:hypothetical protein
MKTMKTFDLFQKIAVDNINQPTYIGSCLSMISISVILYLLIKELFNFFTPNVIKDTIVMNESNYFPHKANDKLLLKFSIAFTHTPCSILTLDREELIGTHIPDIEQNITKTSFDKGGNIKNGTYYPYKTSLLEKSLTEGESCHIAGYVNITKSPGDIHFSFHPYEDIYEKFIKPSPKLLGNIRLSHQIKELHFGDLTIADLDRIEQKFGSNTFELLDQCYNKEFKDYSIDDKSYNYEYYLVLVPYLFVNEIEDQKYLTYVYSISQKVSLNNNTAEMPMVMMNYDISNVGMRYTLRERNISHSLTHICAIVGGVFVMFSIINRLLLALGESLFAKENKTN